MTAEVISFRPTDAELEAAWEAYDEAQRRAMELYRDEAGTTSRQRMEAVIEASRRLVEFRRICARADTKR